MPPKTTRKATNQHRHHTGKPPGKRWNKPNTAKPPTVNAKAEEWGTNASPWPEVIDESDVSKEIIFVWRRNVYAAENGDEPQKMEGLYDRLDREREKWNDKLNNPLTWGWGGGQDGQNDWANDVECEPHKWEKPQQGRNDKTPDGPPSARNPEQIPPQLLELVSSKADKLKAEGRKRSYAFARLSTEAKAEKIREVAYQISVLLRAPNKH